ncbi:hypothetical protein Tco_1108417 [Tanacetum coccineum]
MIQCSFHEDSSEIFSNPNSNSSISMDDFVEMDDVWDNLDFRDLTNEATKFPVKPKFLSSSNRIHLHSPYNLQITCKIGFVDFDPYIEPQSPFNIMSRKAYNSIMKHEIVYTRNNMVGFAKNLQVFVGGHQFLINFIILENINEFMEKGLTEVLFGQPFKEHVGIIEDRVNGVLWFKIRDDKTIFNMPSVEKRFGKLIIRQHNTMRPILKISDEDKTRGIHHPYQKIKGFYQGCLKLGEEYKHDQEIIDWIKGHATSHSSSTVTYTFVYTDSEPGRVFWGADKELSNGGPEHPLSPDYVPGTELPPSPIDVPYIPEPEYPEYLVPSDDEVPIEDQPLPIDASHVALSPGYMADSDLEEDPKEDPEGDHTDYLADGGDGDDEPSDDDDDNDDTDDEDEEPFKDEDVDEEEKEHLAPADSSVIPVVDHVTSAGDTEAFETDKSATTPRSPQTKVPLTQIRLRMA